MLAFQVTTKLNSLSRLNSLAYYSISTIVRYSLQKGGSCMPEIIHKGKLISYERGVASTYESEKDIISHRAINIKMSKEDISQMSCVDFNIVANLIAQVETAPFNDSNHTIYKAYPGDGLLSYTATRKHNDSRYNVTCQIWVYFSCDGQIITDFVHPLGKESERDGGESDDKESVIVPSKSRNRKI